MAKYPLIHRRLFAVPIKPSRCTIGSMGPVNGINKDVSDTRLLPMTVSAYPMDWVCFCHLLKTQECCLCPNRSITHLWLPIHLHHPPHPNPILHTPLLQCAIYDITVTVKNFIQNPAVLAIDLGPNTVHRFKYEYKYYKFSTYKYNCKYFGQDRF